MQPLLDAPLLIALAGLLAASAVLAGLLAGLLGVGGGIVIVPMLFWILATLDVDPAIIMHVAVATSLLTIIPTSVSSALSHHRRGNIDPGILRRWVGPVFFGALAGGLCSRVIAGETLTGLFGVIALLVTLNMVTARTFVLADRPPRSRFLHGAIGSAIGFVSALMGIGGGTFSVPTLTAFSFPILKAVGTASVFGLVIAVPGVLGFVWSGWDVAGRPPFSLGYVNLGAAAIIVPITVATAPLGARIASAINQRALKLCFAVFLALTALRMLVTAWGG